MGSHRVAAASKSINESAHRIQRTISEKQSSSSRSAAIHRKVHPVRIMPSSSRVLREEKYAKNGYKKIGKL